MQQKAVTLSDEDVAAMAREYIQWMDTHNEIAGPETAMGQRLANLTKDIKVQLPLKRNLIVAKSKLSEKQLSRQIGFEPVFADNNKIENEKEHLLVQNLMGKRL